MVHDPRLLGDQILALAVRPAGVLFLSGWNRCHAAMALLPAQPANKGAHQQFGVEAIGLRAPVFARYRHARRMDDIGLDLLPPQPARQPEAVASGFVSDDDALNRVPGSAGFVAPAMQELE